MKTIRAWGPHQLLARLVAAPQHTAGNARSSVMNRHCLTPTSVMGMPSASGSQPDFICSSDFASCLSPSARVFGWLLVACIRHNQRKDESRVHDPVCSFFADRLFKPASNVEARVRVR